MASGSRFKIGGISLDATIMSFSIRKKLLFGFAISVFALAGIGWLSYHTVTQLIATQRWVTHTREVIAELEAGWAQLTQAETAQRGYLLTGDERFLRDSRAAQAQVTGWHEKLIVLMADNPEQQQRIQQLETVIAQRLAVLNDRIKLRQEKGIQAAAEAVARRQGTELMDRIRQGIADIHAIEVALLQERQQTVKDRARVSLLTILAGSALTCLVGIAAFSVIQRDLKSREQVEQQVKEGRALLHSILDNTPATVYLKDLEGRYLFVNRRFQELTGRTREEMLGKTVYDVTRKDLAEIAHGHHLTVLSSPDPVEFEETVLHPDGPHTHLSVKFPVRDANGKVYGTAGVSTDINERKRVEAALQKAKEELESRVDERTTALAAINVALSESEDRVRAVLDAALSAVIVMDSAGKVVDWNTRAEALFGWSHAQALGNKLSDLIIPPRFREAHERGMTHFLQTGEGPALNRLIELSALRRDGTEFPVEISISVLKAGHAVTFCGFVTDITERKRAQEEILKLNTTLEQRVAERTAQLEAANKELESFSYSVSHDLRAPLRHISGFAELLGQSQADLNDAGKRYLSIISGAAGQMGALIDDLLVFSRMGRAEMRRVSVKMDELVSEVVREMDHDLAGRNIAWDIGSLPEITGDRAMLKQVWVNLISNAVKYTQQCELATIKIASHQRDNGDWEFSVKDNGAGFDMKYVGKLFGVFQRLHQAEEFEGTGIGLANVQRIILRHGGRVWAEGKVNAGATFYFSLPNNEKEKA